MYSYIVYLFKLNQPTEKILCKTRMEADLLRDVAIQDGYYKYELIVIDLEQDMPIDIHFEYFDLEQTYNKTRKRKK